eukprot:Seg1997.1_Seg1997.2 transcript_id=Seg1997.1_Seg1997.2/GoldUCD/mRNA.D3Y31 product="hypothetical protein" protein_id=Seg1997.1_Seg1997.2/GoldUCD/D3Y31
MILRATKTDIEVIDLTKSRANQLANTMKNKGYTIKSSNTQIKPRPRILPVTSQNTTVKSATRCRRVMIFIMVTTLCIALAAFGLTMVLQFSDARQQGKVGKMVFVVGRGENRTENNSTTGKVGASTSNDPGYAQRLKLLESNLTRLEALEANLTKLRNLESKIETLKAKLTPQQQEIEKLNNLTKANEKTINTLETRLAEERAKRDALNLTVISLTRSQQAWQSATSLVNATLKSDVKDLKIQIANTKTTLNNIESNSSLNFTNLVSKIEQEVTHRRGNDSALKAEIDLNTLKRQGAITNLTRDLALLSTKASQDNKDLETRINNTISGSIMSLQTADQNTFSQVAAVNKTLRNMIMNISLTPGPQGLPGTNGAGNLSRCYEIVEAYDSDTTVPYISSIVPPGYIVTGIFCTATKGARVTSIVDHIALGGKHFKTCRYHRDSSGGGNIQLQSYMWVCPKNS